MQLEDLQSSLNDFLATKTAATAPSVDPGPNIWQGFEPQQATENAPAPRAEAPQISTATAPPATQQQEPVVEFGSAVEEDEQEVDLNIASFGGLDAGFLKDMQSGLEALGYDLTSTDIMQQLSGDAGLPEVLLPHMGEADGDAAVLREKVRQWQQAIQQQIELEKELAKKKRRPVWRCAACGRYGCPVAPYIESYQEY